MDINGLERIKSSRVAIAAGLLVIAAGGAAYFYFVYQPEMQSETVAAKPPVARKPPPAPAKLAAKPVQPTVPATASPGVSPAVSPAQQPVTAPVPSPVVPDPEMTAEPAKPEPVAQKDRPKRRKAATSSKPVTEPAQVATMDNKPDSPDISEQVAAQTQDVLLAPAPVVSVSIAPVEPVPAPVESVPVAPVEPAPVESAPVAATDPPQNRGPITPKYNDVMTAVLRGDREAAKELLELGWWVDKPSANGVTPLVAAVMNRDAQMVQLLLEHGAEPTSQALRLARKNKDAATAALLEQKGAR